MRIFRNKIVNIVLIYKHLGIEEMKKAQGLLNSFRLNRFGFPLTFLLIMLVLFAVLAPILTLLVPFR